MLLKGKIGNWCRNDKCFTIPRLQSHALIKSVAFYTKTASGLDKIPSKLLKIGGDTLAPSITANLQPITFNRNILTCLEKGKSVPSLQEWQ